MSYGFASYGMPQTYTVFSAYPGPSYGSNYPPYGILPRQIWCRLVAIRVRRTWLRLWGRCVPLRFLACVTLVFLLPDVPGSVREDTGYELNAPRRRRRLAFTRFALGTADALWLVTWSTTSDNTPTSANDGNNPAHGWFTIDCSALRVIKTIIKASIKIIDGRFHGWSDTGSLFSVSAGLGCPPTLCRQLSCVTTSTQRRSRSSDILPSRPGLTGGRLV